MKQSDNKITVTTSWDDGHKLDLKIVSLLEKYKLKGTFYVSPNNREFPKSDLLTTTEIKLISKNFEIGAHTMTHPELTKIGIKEAREEIMMSKNYLEKLTGKNVASFCYPKGSFNENIKSVVKKCGFVYARTVKRYEFVFPLDLLESGTSLHAYRQYQDVFKILGFSRFNLRRFILNMNWDELAINVFDSLKDGGLFHFWGHSWIIEEKNEWEKLERVFRYISKRKNILYLENKDLVKHD